MDVLGHPVLFGQDKGKAWGEPTGPKLFIGPAFDGKPAHHGNGQHAAFIATTRKQVDAFYEAALANGAATKANPVCGLITIPTTTAPMSAIPRETSCKLFATAQMDKAGKSIMIRVDQSLRHP